MVEGDDRVEEHEEGFGHAEDVFEWASGLGLEVLHAVVADVADGTTGHGREIEAGNLGFTVLSELGREERERIG